MSIIIKLQEKNNKLLFSDTPIALLCGNSNYQLNIDFDEDWSRFSTKTAVFSINCKNHLVEFSGNTVDVPCLPNCHNMNFYVMCSDENLGQRTTNNLSFDLIPTKAGFSDEVFDNANNYLSQLKSLLNSIETGTYVIPKAIHAESADVANNVSNPNLLLNGDFKINQRGLSSYTSTGKFYTVDRWIISSSVDGNLTKTANGVVVNLKGAWAVFQQMIEDSDYFSGKTVTFSVKVKNYTLNKGSGYPCIQLVDSVGRASKQIFSGQNGVYSLTRTIPENATNIRLLAFANYSSGTDFDGTIEIEWAKLEIGTQTTPFVSPNALQELSNCMRYYQVRSASFNFATNGEDRTPMMRNAGTTGTVTINGATKNFADSELY